MRRSAKADEGNVKEVLQAKCACFLPGFSLKSYKYGQNYFGK